ncbi:hypothetical protein MA03_02875 [Infirmifilum uzonense]|uniref:CRISPR-associated exonuclease Cas4 n=1 Tax=Infirmifilum uzonense TaxID=1550241 RepID=A0A0F7FHS1_9CREN|nr:CRISPR-associated protein Cas4 [Infirmifilum uzonense]AKG38428.1 hypothetical protein MA03_02875 [Infirmifilum uzonense]
MEEWTLTVNDLKHFAYCEAIVYITHGIGVRERETEYMAYGGEVEKEEFLQQLLKKYSVARIHRGVTLSSRELQLTGTPDAVLETRMGELIPVEVKWAEPPRASRVKKDHLVQLIAYAILIEKSWPSRKSSVKRGLVYYLRPKPRFIEVYISSEDKKSVIQMVKRAVKVALGEVEPLTRRDCSSCNYRAYCPFAYTRNSSSSSI